MIKWTFAKSQDRGPRAAQEDAAGCRVYGRQAIAAIADGMGGSDAGLGGAASKAALRAFLADEDGYFRDRAFRAARAVVDLQPGGCRYGTTLTAVEVALDPMGGARATGSWLHVGDTRLYHYEHHVPAITRLTQDHTAAMNAVAAGTLHVNDVRRSPLRHYLTRCLGDQAPAERDWSAGVFGMSVGDVIVLVSDGVWDLLAGEDFARILYDQAEQGLQRQAESILDAARERGLEDNATCALLRADLAPVG